MATSKRSLRASVEPLDAQVREPLERPRLLVLLAASARASTSWPWRRRARARGWTTTPTPPESCEVVEQEGELHAASSRAGGGPTAARGGLELARCAPRRSARSLSRWRSQRRARAERGRPARRAAAARARPRAGRRPARSAHGTRLRDRDLGHLARAPRRRGARDARSPAARPDAASDVSRRAAAGAAPRRLPRPSWSRGAGSRSPRTASFGTLSDDGAVGVVGQLDEQLHERQRTSSRCSIVSKQVTQRRPSAPPRAAASRTRARPLASPGRPSAPTSVAASTLARACSTAPSSTSTSSASAS